MLTGEDTNWVEWSPLPHVKGRYEELPPTAQPTFRVRVVEARCEACGARIRQPCTANAPRSRIARFAAAHASCRAASPPDDDAGLPVRASGLPDD